MCDNAKIYNEDESQIYKDACTLLVSIFGYPHYFLCKLLMSLRRMNL